MFKKKNGQKKLDLNQQEISTIIGQGYTFTGEINGSSIIRIEGKIIGDVHVESGVVLGENGVIEGDIYTKSAIIYGTVTGDVQAGQLEIKRTGRISGDITTNNLEIELGAQYNGRLHMQKETPLIEPDQERQHKIEKHAKVIDVAV
jgi:cytoskeletal protein CcmA (bactofilin family)